MARSLIKLIYNPVAGDATFKKKLDMVFARFQAAGYQVVPFRTDLTYPVESAFEDFDLLHYHAVMACGGDGTIHQVVNSMLDRGLDIPLGIIPSGTANDLAAHLNLPQDVDAACQVIIKGRQAQVDLGLANGRYFVNVASAGLLTDVSHKVEPALKNVFGKMAYYVGGLGQIPQFKAVPVQIETKAGAIQRDILLFLVLNGNTAGGFRNMAPSATVNDGKLDVLIVNNCSLRELFGLFFRFFRGEHIQSSFVEYFQVDQIKFSAQTNIEVDLDGEAGPNFPLNISIVPGKLKVFVP